MEYQLTEQSAYESREEFEAYLKKQQEQLESLHDPPPELCARFLSQATLRQHPKLSLFKRPRKAKRQETW